MRAGGMPGEIKPVRIAAEGSRVLVSPGNGPPALIDHREEIAAGFVRIGKIDADEIRAGLDEGLCQVSILRRAAPGPGAAMQEHEYGRGRAPGLVDFHFL